MCCISPSSILQASMFPSVWGSCTKIHSLQTKHNIAIRRARKTSITTYTVGWGREPEAQEKIKVRERLAEATAPSHAYCSEEESSEIRTSSQGKNYNLMD